MADSKISELAAVTDLQVTDEFVLARAGTTKKLDASDLRSGLAPATITTHYQIIGTGTYETTRTADRFYFGQTFLPYAVATLTGILVRCGAAASGNIRVALIDSAGTIVASSASTAHAGSYAMQAVPFSATYGAAAGVYYLGIIASSATAGFVVIPPFGSSGFTDPGSFTVPGSITPPSVTAYASDMPSISTY